MFVNTFVINWNDINYMPQVDSKSIEIPLVDSVAVTVFTCIIPPHQIRFIYIL